MLRTALMDTVEEMSVTSWPVDVLSWYLSGTAEPRFWLPEKLGLASVPAVVSGLRKPVNVKGGGGLTTCWSAGETLDRKFPSPGYEAVIGWTPTASADVVKAALPEESGVA